VPPGAKSEKKRTDPRALPALIEGGTRTGTSCGWPVTGSMPDLHETVLQHAATSSCSLSPASSSR